MLRFKGVHQMRPTGLWKVKKFRCSQAKEMDTLVCILC